MQITISKSGIMTTVQDMGRWQYLSHGVPPSGVMDSLSARIANLALGNPADAAVIEFTYGNAGFRSATDSLIAFAGDGAFLHAGRLALPSERPIYLPAGTAVRLSNNPNGARTYLAIAGGWDVPSVLGSKSTYTLAAFGGYNGRPLQTGDLLRAQDRCSPTTAGLRNRLHGAEIRYPKWSIARDLLLPADRKTIRVVPAHEFTWFEGQSVVSFLSEPYTISAQSNRMGYRIDGPAIRKLVTRELLSTAVTPGTIQVTGDGQLILLMADCQTTGGYPRIAQVATVDMPLCGQLKPGDSVSFQEISRTDAEKLHIHQERQISKLTAAVMMNIEERFLK